MGGGSLAILMSSIDAKSMGIDVPMIYFKFRTLKEFPEILDDHLYVHYDMKTLLIPFLTVLTSHIVMASTKGST